MWMLASFLNIIIGTSLAGIAIIVALVAGYDDMQGVVVAAVIGFVISLPVTWYVARQITHLRKGQKI
ncbi:CTP synthetase [Roseovarius sp. S4756]|uniref:CTP synthetase n=1 Tax=Roseovarius maritimus TaxID=3342637 RepID=UPI00372AF806